MAVCRACDYHPHSVSIARRYVQCSFVYVSAITFEPFEISQNFYGNKIRWEAWMSLKIAALWCTAKCGWLFNDPDILVATKNMASAVQHCSVKWTKDKVRWYNAQGEPRLQRNKLTAGSYPEIWIRGCEGVGSRPLLSTRLPLPLPSPTPHPLPLEVGP